MGGAFGQQYAFSRVHNTNSLLLLEPHPAGMMKIIEVEITTMEEKAAEVWIVDRGLISKARRSFFTFCFGLGSGRGF